MLPSISTQVGHSTGTRVQFFDLAPRRTLLLQDGSLCGNAAQSSVVSDAIRLHASSATGEPCDY